MTDFDKLERILPNIFAGIAIIGVAAFFWNMSYKNKRYQHAYELCHDVQHSFNERSESCRKAIELSKELQPYAPGKGHRAYIKSNLLKIDYARMLVKNGDYESAEGLFDDVLRGFMLHWSRDAGPVLSETQATVLRYLVAVAEQESETLPVIERALDHENTRITWPILRGDLSKVSEQ
ncbi:hypothetical protein [Celeribacter neptunius]|uniref:hypothetical protein n=1 Tax=Celeribacter neptunius TaxID=588602 RepID=UPI000B7E69F5|nr:hypothetical protein [Celeribacter neptunius]